jgi:hypothetical protein
MPVAIEMFTTPVVVPTGGITLGIEIQTTVGGIAKVLNSAAAAYPVLPAGTYAFFVFLAKANALLRQWVLDAATALGITTRPALANVLLKFTVPSPLVPTANGNMLVVSFVPTGFAIGANVMVITGGFLDANTTGAFWTKLGMVRDSFNTKGATTVTTVLLSFTAARQSSYLYVYERQGEDQGDIEEAQGNTRVLRDNTVRQHVFGSTRADRVIRLFEHEATMLGGPVPVATFSSINGARNQLTLKTQDEDGLVNCSNLYQNEDLFTLGAYVRVGLSRHVTRCDLKTGAPKTTSATLFEAASANAGASMVAGQTLFRVSEFDAMMRRVLDVGYVVYHEPDDTTGQTRFKGEAYALMIDGKVKVTPSRVDKFFDLYQVTLLLVRRDVPELML